MTGSDPPEMGNWYNNCFYVESGFDSFLLLLHPSPPQPSPIVTRNSQRGTFHDRLFQLLIIQLIKYSSVVCYFAIHHLSRHVVVFQDIFQVLSQYTYLWATAGIGLLYFRCSITRRITNLQKFYLFLM